MWVGEGGVGAWVDEGVGSCGEGWARDGERARSGAKGGSIREEEWRRDEGLAIEGWWAGFGTTWGAPCGMTGCTDLLGGAGLGACGTPHGHAPSPSSASPTSPTSPPSSPIPTNQLTNQITVTRQDEGEEEETDNLVNQVLDEIGIGNMTEVSDRAGAGGRVGETDE